MLVVKRMKKPTLKEKVRQYELFLHTLQMHAEITMDNDKIISLIGNACRWSRAHRVGNGELSDKQQKAEINKAFRILLMTKD